MGFRSSWDDLMATKQLARGPHCGREFWVWMVYFLNAVEILVCVCFYPTLSSLNLLVLAAKVVTGCPGAALRHKHLSVVYTTICFTEVLELIWATTEAIARRGVDVVWWPSQWGHRGAATVVGGEDGPFTAVGAGALIALIVVEWGFCVQSALFCLNLSRIARERNQNNATQNEVKGNSAASDQTSNGRTQHVEESFSVEKLKGLAQGNWLRMWRFMAKGNKGSRHHYCRIPHGNIGGHKVVVSTTELRDK